MNETRASYTVVRTGSRIYYGAIRRRHDDAVIWECADGHERPTSAQQCAQREWRRRAAQAAGPDDPRREGGES